jgi:hypothetical protein
MAALHINYDDESKRGLSWLGSSTDRLTAKENVSTSTVKESKLVYTGLM